MPLTLKHNLSIAKRNAALPIKLKVQYAVWSLS